MEPPLPPVPPAFRGVLRTDLTARALYAQGAGIARTLPAAVAVPVDTADVQRLVSWARETGTALVPRGSGSGMAAGAVGPGVVVDLSRLRALEAVAPDGGAVMAGAGVLQREVDAAARLVGRRFPVAPSSGAFCTVGGMVATNAAGARSLRVGATRPWVRGLQVVWEDGSATWVRRDAPWPREVPAVARLAAVLAGLRDTPAPAPWVRPGVRKESSGYALADTLAPGGHLVDLLVGSEGTLGLFTAVELALAPLPGATASVLAAFPSLEAAAACAVEAREAGASACELLDRTFLEVAASAGPTGVPADTEAVLLTEGEGADAGEAAGWADRWTTRCRHLGAMQVETGLTREAEHRLWALRHAASPILSQLPPSQRSMQFIEDGCVPPAHFPAYVRGVRAALARQGIPGVIFGHAGDAHAHVNPLVDVTRPGWRAQVAALLDEVVALTASLGGTLAGEHGDGRLRAPLLARGWPAEALAAFAAVKAAADPAGVLNPGCKVPLPGAAPFDTLRHDPEAPPLPAAAAAALDDIERTRDWGRYRLAGFDAPG
jgi:FAD/FMN-containing dehydrogenase